MLNKEIIIEAFCKKHNATYIPSSMGECVGFTYMYANKVYYVSFNTAKADVQNSPLFI